MVKGNFIKKLFLIGLFMLFMALVACNNDSSDSTDSNTDSNDSQDTTTTDEDLGDELVIAYSAQPPTLDPHLTTAVATSDIMRGVFETLVTVDSDYNFQPMLADTYEVSDDGTKITFHLREGVLFHNGKELKAEDVVASMERWRDNSNRADAFRETTFEATDDYTVVMTLPAPMSTTLSVLTWMVGSYAAIMPKEIIESATELGVEEYIGTGPFKYDEWVQDSHVKLTRFADYKPRDEEPNGLAGRREALVEEVYFRFVPDHATRVAGILSGEYHIIHNTPFDNAETLEADPNVINHNVPGSTYVFIFNKKEGIFQDLELRKAVRLGLDIEAIMKGTVTDEQYYTLNHNLVKPYLLTQFNSHVGLEEYEEYDPERAKQMIEELGYAGEEVVIITTRDYEGQYNASVVAQQQLEELGLKVKLEVYDWPTLLDRTEDPTLYDLNIMSWGAQPEPTSYGFLRKGYDSGWTDEDEFAQLLENFRKQPSLEIAAGEAYDAILQWMADNVPILKLGDTDTIISSRTSVNNFQNQNGFIIWNTSVSKE